MTMQRTEPQLRLPGFRFHPTEQELLGFYLSPVAHGKKHNFDVIGCLDIYRHEPWELPGLAKIGEREWYFLVPRDRRSGSGGRANRTTASGFWKATGSDRAIRSSAEPRLVLGMKKTLVFYGGRAPRGTRTDWIMNEYRLPEHSGSAAKTPLQEDIVLCKVYRKATSMKELEQRAAKEEDTKASQGCTSASISDHQENYQSPSVLMDFGEVKEMNEEAQKDLEVTSSLSIVRPVSLPELQVSLSGMEWMQDPFFTQLRSPWMEQWSPHANILNF